jgi:glycosyltransferase involved in cell wall biosynthesis
MLSATKNRPEVSVVIPAYNEEARLANVIKSYKDFCNSYEIIIVCNGCSDSTPKIANDIAEKDDRIRVLIFEKKLGKGGAILEGFKEARGQFVGFLDADESVEASEYLKLVETVKASEVDGAIASRRVKGANILLQQPLMRRIASNAFNLLVRYMFGLDFRDTQCGAKIFRRDVIENIVHDLTSTGYEFDVELLWKLQKGSRSIREVAITWKHDEGSKFRLMNAPNMLFVLMMIKLRRKGYL